MGMLIGLYVPHPTEDWRTTCASKSKYRFL
jgi:hypothetical protein